MQLRIEDKDHVPQFVADVFRALGLVGRKSYLMHK